jgi:hypothetical protein
VGADGYTNLERVLHQMAAEVEGRATANSRKIAAPKAVLD